jgi:hypothetical protein
VNSMRIFAIGAALMALTLLMPGYEPLLEALAAIGFVVMIAFGFALHPRKDVFYIRTSTQSRDLDHNLLVEHDQLAVRVEPARLWILFLPTFLCVAFLVVSAAQGAFWKASIMNRVFADFGPWPVMMCRLPIFLIGGALWVWLTERRALRDADACSASSVKVRDGRVTYQFRDSRGGYGGGDDLFFGLVRPPVVARLVFYNVTNPDVSKIGMGLLFHRVIIMGRGLTELDHSTVASHRFSAEVAS